jgi:hypothetical protein
MKTLLAWGVTRERIPQIQEQALQKMRVKIENQDQPPGVAARKTLPRRPSLVSVRGKLRIFKTPHFAS